jgi:hypothetical protein
MVALRAASVPLPGKNILQMKARIVNPYSGKGMTIRAFILCYVVAGVAALLK